MTVGEATTAPVSDERQIINALITATNTENILRYEDGIEYPAWSVGEDKDNGTWITQVEFVRNGDDFSLSVTTDSERAAFQAISGLFFDLRAESEAER